MKTLKMLGLAVLAGSMLTAFTTFAGPGGKSYQVTGPVIELNDTSITVMKGEEKWQVARDKDTKVSGELKVGAKVTIEYRMVATNVEVKAAKASEKAVEKTMKAEKKAEKKK